MRSILRMGMAGIYKAFFRGEGEILLLFFASSDTSYVQITVQLLPLSGCLQKAKCANRKMCNLCLIAAKRSFSLLFEYFRQLLTSFHQVSTTFDNSSAFLYICGTAASRMLRGLAFCALMEKSLCRELLCEHYSTYAIYGTSLKERDDILNT